MSDVAELLALLHGARSRVSTLRATVRMWRHPHRQALALERAGWSAYGPALAPEVVEELVRVWFAPPDRAREEREGHYGSSFGVQRGGDWWSYDPGNGARSNEGAPEQSGAVAEELGWLLDPAPMIGLLEFDGIAAAMRAGRSVLRVRALPRSPAAGEGIGLVRLGAAGADELLLEADAERGTLLRIESRLEGEPFFIAEVAEIAFDEAFGEDTFTFTPPPGERVRSILELEPVRHDLTLEQAVALAPFAIWVPASPPANWEAVIGFAAAQDELVPEVHLHYRAPGGTPGFSLAESPAGRRADDTSQSWSAIERGGRPLDVSEPSASRLEAQVRLELEGTRILLHSTDLGVDALADVAAGLVRAP